MDCIKSFKPGTKYLAIYDESMGYDDGYGGRSTHKYVVADQFANKEALLEMLQRNASSVFSKREYLVLEVKKLNPVTTVSINVEGI